MAEARLDQIVKGAPTGAAKIAVEKASNTAAEKYTPSDPLATLPSSPPQIYLNLLILECSFRSQYLVLRARRRLHSFFLLLLTLWISLFTYLLFLKPREDGLGIGGSVYWFIEMMEKVALMGGVLTAILMWGTGQWERGMRWPRRWLHVANRGLRSMNTKIVIVKESWWKEGLGHMSFLFPLDSLIGKAPGSEWHYVEHSTSHIHPTARNSDEETGHIIEEDLAPGGDHIKLLLLPKAFSPEFRENWEEYRMDYWEKENERRAQLRQRLKDKKRQKAKQHGGWLWWSGLWKFKSLPRPSQTGAPERHHNVPHHAHHRSTHSITEKEPKAQRRRSLLRSESSHSRNSSRSSTPPLAVLEADEKSNAAGGGSAVTDEPRPGSSGSAGGGGGSRVRRGSSATNARRKASRRESGLMKVSPLTRSESATDDQGLLGGIRRGGETSGSRPTTPGSEDGFTT